MKQVVVVDLVPYRLELAKQLGAMIVDGRSTDVVSEVRQYLPEGPDVVSEATGRPVAQY